MSKFVDEIIEDVKNNPKTWSRYKERGLKKGNIKISDCGNGSKLFLFWFTSIVDIYVNDKSTWVSTSWRDRYRLEELFLWWMRNASVEMLEE